MLVWKKYFSSNKKIIIVKYKFHPIFRIYGWEEDTDKEEKNNNKRREQLRNIINDEMINKERNHEEKNRKLKEKLVVC